MTMDKCTCPLCNELNLQDAREIVVAHMEYIKNCINDENENDKLQDVLFSLFNSGYKNGYITSLSLRIEEDVQSLKYITDNWDN